MAKQNMNFVSLGMFVLDELRLPNGRALHDCVGGSGAYSTLGARIATPPSDPATVGALILAGRDFPNEIAELFRSWGITLVMDIDKTKNSTRGLLEYHDEAFGSKTFHYTTKPLQPIPSRLPLSLLSSKSFHLLLPPDALKDRVAELVSLRHKSRIHGRPLLVWEPLPSKCTKEHIEAHLLAFQLVDVFSPNHLELLALFDKPSIPFDASDVEACADAIAQADMAPAASHEVSSPSSSRRRHAVVVRAGEHGCLVVADKTKFWLPPYFEGEQGGAERVVDATGGGNAFLGAFTVALQATGGDLMDAAIRGTVAASFAIEQLGMPRRTGAEGLEAWNGVEVVAREGEYWRRLERRR